MTPIEMPKPRGPRPKDPVKLAAWLVAGGGQVTEKRKARAGAVNMGRPPADPIARLEWEKERDRLNAEKGIASRDVAAVAPVAVTPTTQGSANAKRSDEQIVKDGMAKIDLLARLTRGALKGSVRSVIVSGAPGIGKTYTITTETTQDLTARPAQHQSEFVSGGVVTPLHLYKLLYRNRHKGALAVIDDSDGVYKDEDALNMLKAATDTGNTRVLSYLSNTLADEGIPQRFVYEGSIMFLTNLNFERYLATGQRTVLGAHLSAFMSRSYYLDMDLHDRDELIVWTKHRTLEQRILQKHGLTDEEAVTAFDWIMERPDSFREFSLRIPVKVAELMSLFPETWRDDASKLLYKQR